MGWLKTAFKAGWTWLGSSSIQLFALVALASFGLGVSIGISWAEGSQAKEDLQQQKVVARAYVDAIVRGQSDVNTLQTDLTTANTYAKTLKERLRHAQLLATPPLQPPLAAGSQTPSGEVPGPSRQAPVDVGPVLSAYAVGVWNSALAGADVPAGACRAADPTNRACAAATLVTVDDAWDNHAENAASCRADRIRYQRLIDHLNTTRPDSTRSNP